VYKFPALFIAKAARMQSLGVLYDKYLCRTGISHLRLSAFICGFKLLRLFIFAETSARIDSVDFRGVTADVTQGGYGDMGARRSGIS